MFYCDPCGDDRGWPTDTLMRSRGRCEMCQRPADCNDVPSSRLPSPRRHRPKIHRINTLPKPECKWGYTHQQIELIMGDRSAEFHRWMAGQTFSVCDGREGKYEQGQYVPTGCGPHGVVIYRSDVEQFLRGGPPLD